LLGTSKQLISFNGLTGWKARTAGEEGIALDKELKWTRGACLAKDLDPTTLVAIPDRDMESIDTILPLAGKTGASPGLPAILCSKSGNSFISNIFI
jgi:hypothetical protein